MNISNNNINDAPAINNENTQPVFIYVNSRKKVGAKKKKKPTTTQRFKTRSENKIFAQKNSIIYQALMHRSMSIKEFYIMLQSRYEKDELIHLNFIREIIMGQKWSVDLLLAARISETLNISITDIADSCKKACEYHLKKSRPSEVPSI